MAPFDVNLVRADFPLLARRERGKLLAYLDSAASAQKPRAVIDAVSRYYAEQHANIHRGVYRLSEEATALFEASRAEVARFLRAPDPRGVVFVRGATEAINLVADSWGRAHLRPGDEILLTAMEHHANIVPWQIAAERAGARVVPCPVTPRGEVDLEAFARLLGPRTRMAAFTHVSNALGTVNPVAEMTRLAKAAGAAVLVDACQSASHFEVDVAALGCDFLCFSGHKVCGPTGIGVLWGRPELLDAMPPYQGGGDMIQRVDFAGTTYRAAPERFEAGTPHIAGAVGLAAALRYVAALRPAAHAHEQRLLALATERLRAIPGLRIVGEAPEKVAVVSFLLDGAHPHDVGTLLDADAVAVRVGHHCCMPLMSFLGIPGTVRASFAFYNTEEEVLRLESSLRRVRAMTA
ncbi:MAG: aminotransferase class V-fold PLP-dependent enzyme [Opitutia bacterium]|jgi:cysteine desulfurase/selenocysteine lyase